MAKVTGPLFSVDARGKIADSIVFGGWRGIKTVRRYTVPTNPQTVAQSVTRGFFASGVSLYHTLSAADKAALRVAASGQPYSGFNMFVSGVKSALDQGLDWVTISGVSAAPGSVVVSGNASADVQLKITYGSTTALTGGEVFTTPVDGVFSESFPAPVDFDKLHYRVDVAAEGYTGFSGIYPFTVTGGGVVEEPVTFDPMEFGTPLDEFLLALGSDDDGVLIYKAGEDQWSWSMASSWHMGETDATAAKDAQFSPGGNYLAVIHDSLSHGKGLAILDSSDPAAPSLFASETLNPLPDNLYWSPCGEYIALRYDDSAIFSLYGLNSLGELVPITTYKAPGDIYSLDWSLDSKYIAVGHDTSPYFTLLDFSSGQSLTSADTFTLAGCCNVVKFSPDGTHVACGHAGNPGLTILPVSSAGVIGTELQPSANHILTHLSWIVGSPLVLSGVVSGASTMPCYKVDIGAGTVTCYTTVESAQTNIRSYAAAKANSIAVAGMSRFVTAITTFAHLYVADDFGDLQYGQMMPVQTFCSEVSCTNQGLTAPSNFVAWHGSI